MDKKKMLLIETCRKFYELASEEVGTTETPGPGNNTRVLEYHKATKGSASLDEVPWCASFASWVIEQCGFESTKSAWARHYLSWGIATETPNTGCIAVFSRGEASGHVGFYSHEDEKNIYVLGGNQGDKVCVAAYPKERLLGYRVPFIEMQLFADLVEVKDAIGEWKIVYREKAEDCKNRIRKSDIFI